MAINKVVVQLKAEEGCDFDRLYLIEETLFQAFSQANDGQVDGHDIGEGKFNIFIHTRSSWGPVLERIDAFLKLRGALDEAVVAKFHGRTERYEVVHPANYHSEFSL